MQCNENSVDGNSFCIATRWKHKQMGSEVALDYPNKLSVFYNE
jgi:hypothetical protein